MKFDDYINTEQFANILKVSKRRATEICNTYENKLKCVKIGNSWFIPKNFTDPRKQNNKKLTD